MSTDTATQDDVEHGADHAHGHFGFREAINIAIILAVITFLETMTYFVDIPLSIEEPAIIIMMIAKFAIVVAYFMHLKFENKLFTYLFVAGLVLAVLVYVATLMTFGWID